MDIATGAMSTVIHKLGKLLVGEYKLHKGVKGEIDELVKELEVMDAALRKVADMPADQLGELDKIWARDVRDMSYDIEDNIDTFMMHEHTKPKGFLDRITNLLKKAKANHQIHSVFKDIMEDVKKASKRRDRYKVDDVAARPNVATVDPRLDAMYRKATELVGIDGPKNELAKRLLEQDCSSMQQPKIITIFGFGGLGKTTLANSVLQDLKAMFDCHVFVSVSLNPNIKMILKNILDQLGAYPNEIWDEMQLINKIRESLKDRRCLCVIDDVWNESHWDTIKHALEDAKHGSKIIITTRINAVAERAGRGLYEMKPLSDDDSRKLLNRRIFGSEYGCPPDLREVTGKILKKCGGVPLAIITIASLLDTKPKHLLEWEKVNKSIGTGLGDGLDVNKMREILKLSYKDLPFHLRTCLLSLSKYPEDTSIRKDVLVWSWIAEGFITEDTQPAGTSLQEVGESYFIELINRSLLIRPVDNKAFFDQDGKLIGRSIDKIGEVHYCQLHDMVLELINQLSAEDGFVTTILSDGEQAGTRTSMMAQKKIRRLSLHNSNKSYAPPEAREQLSRVRSLTVFGKAESIPPLSSFHVLRVLQLELYTDGLDNNHLNDLGKLRHLRFLRLSGYSFTELPESIGKLESLETLDIRGVPWSVVLLLPMSFVKLQKLVRLFADKVRLPDGLALGDMKSLQELVGVYFTPEVMKEISNLKALRVLGIFVETGASNFEESFGMCLQRCTNLQDVDIKTDGRFSCSLDSMQHVPSGLRRFTSGVRCWCTEVFPRWINSSMLSCLTTLSIRLDETLLAHHLERLAELPSLRFLDLSLAHTVDPEEPELQQKLTIHSGACAFRCLRELQYWSCWMILTFQPGAMPDLQRLDIWFAELVETNHLDFGLENLHSLRHVNIVCAEGYRGDRQEVEAAIREALKDNPNHPSFELVSNNGEFSFGWEFSLFRAGGPAFLYGLT